MGLTLPQRLIEAVEEEGRGDWSARLPRIVRHFERRWSLQVGEPYQPGGRTAWVAPARRAGVDELVLKVAWRHTEAADEPAGLRAWDGDGAVILHAVDELDDTVVLLLERCIPGTPLAHRPEPEQDAVIARLLRRLWAAPLDGFTFRPLQQMCDEWADQFDERRQAGWSYLDPGLTDEGIALFRALPGSAEQEVLLATDLHAGNVLAAQREPWLLIDPKPYVGDPAYDPVQHMLNCEERVRTSPLDLVHRMADLVGLDRDRLRLWLFARSVQESITWPGMAEVARRVAPP